MEGNYVHIILQGKGGVGKTLAAALLCQHQLARNANVAAFDTDPVNDSLHQYRGLPVKAISLLTRDKRIDVGAFDGLVTELVWHDGVAVVDNGASTFVPLAAYLAEGHVLPVLREARRKVVLHTVLTGGQAMDDTVHGLQALLGAFDAPVVVWLNEFFGEIAREGRGFLQSQLYLQHRHRIVGTVQLPRLNPDTYGRDFARMLAAKLTFAQALDGEHFELMPRQRLTMLRDELYAQLDALKP